MPMGARESLADMVVRIPWAIGARRQQGRPSENELCCDGGATCPATPPGGFSVYEDGVGFAGAPVDVLTKSSELFAEAAPRICRAL